MLTYSPDRRITDLKIREIVDDTEYIAPRVQFCCNGLPASKASCFSRGIFFGPDRRPIMSIRVASGDRVDGPEGEGGCRARCQGVQSCLMQCLSDERVSATSQSTLVDKRSIGNTQREVTISSVTDDGYTGRARLLFHGGPLCLLRNQETRQGITTTVRIS